MDFDLSDDQRLLKDSVDRLVLDHYGFEQRKKYMAEPDGWSTALWAKYAELGLLGLPFEESLGGFGGGPAEMMIVMEAFGRALILEPFFATVVLGGGLVNCAGSAEQRARLIPLITQGKLKLAFAHVERHSRWNLADVATTARKQGAGWVLDGAKGVVLHGDCADTLLVTARVAGGQRDRAGIGLFLVDADATGVTRRGYPTQDGLRAAEVTLEGAPAEALGEPGGAIDVPLDVDNVDGDADDTRDAELDSDYGATLASGTPRAVITVSDNGPGIADDIAPTLFERFVRGDSSRTRATGSTGLGLAIVHAVVEAHGGVVTVESKPGNTVFRVELPLQKAELAAA